MTFTIFSEDLNREITFRNEDEYELAIDWYNDHSKATVCEFCERHGLNLIEPTNDPYFKTGKKLIDGWADAAMELWARESGRELETNQ